MQPSFYNVYDWGSYMNIFDKYKHIASNYIYWYARDLMFLCDYKEWRNFHKLIIRARAKCLNPDNHFILNSKRVYTNNQGYRLITDYKLSKYACYLITLECDTRKKSIIEAQKYFK